MTIAIVDYGVGTLGSIPNMLARLGASAVITSDPSQIIAADRLILPGVGAFDAGMRNLVERGLVDVLRRCVIDDRVRTLGLCLGMQLMFEGSEEGVLPGLGWLRGHVKRFRFDANQTELRVPHMGWNTVQFQRDSPLLEGLGPEPRFYFAHSYFATCADASDVVGTTDHGVRFASVVQRDNTFGAQFHPEKSHRFGLRLLANFVAL
jgi:imidazole glycerol-phosphate synthase subunit HisH